MNKTNNKRAPIGALTADYIQTLDFYFIRSNNTKTLVRPTPCPLIPTRIKMAWHVLTGIADPVYWDEVFN